MTLVIAISRNNLTKVDLMKVAIFSVLFMMSSVSAFAETPICHQFSRMNGINILSVENRPGWGLAQVQLIPLNETVADLVSKLATGGIKLCVKGTQTADQYLVYEAYVASPGLTPTF